MKKSIPIQEYILPVSIEEDETGGYIATCPKWDDCYAQGDTLEDALYEIQHVATSLIKVYQNEEIQVPLEKKRLKKTLFFEMPLLVNLNG